MSFRWNFFLLCMITIFKMPVRHVTLLTSCLEVDSVFLCWQIAPIPEGLIQFIGLAGLMSIQSVYYSKATRVFNVTLSCIFYLQIFNTTCFLLSFLSTLNLCSGKFGTPITDDVNKLSVLVRILFTAFFKMFTKSLEKDCVPKIPFFCHNSHCRSRISPLIMRFLLPTFPKKWYV